MGARGPAPTPAKTLNMRGSRRANNRPGQVSAVGTPAKMADLDAEASKFWSAVTGTLKRAGWVGRIDSFALTMAAEVWSLYRSAVKAAAADPMDKKARAAVIAYSSAWLGLAARIGLTPADRQRLQLDLNVRADDDDLEKYISGRDDEIDVRRRHAPPVIRDFLMS